MPTTSLVNLSSLPVISAISDFFSHSTSFLIKVKIIGVF